MSIEEEAKAQLHTYEKVSKTVANMLIDEITSIRQQLALAVAALDHIGNKDDKDDRFARVIANETRMQIALLEVEASSETAKCV